MNSSIDKIVQNIEKLLRLISFSKKLNLTLSINKLSITNIDGVIIINNKKNFEFGDKFFLSSNIPTKNTKLQDIKKIKKSKLFKKK